MQTLCLTLPVTRGELATIAAAHLSSNLIFTAQSGLGSLTMDGMVCAAHACLGLTCAAAEHKVYMLQHWPISAVVMRPDRGG